ncbi:unnamed protein product, partial [marine sediment metagenome]
KKALMKQECQTKLQKIPIPLKPPVDSLYKTETWITANGL